MAKRELSSNIRNMKFMQRAAVGHKEEKRKEEEEKKKDEVMIDAGFRAPAFPVRKCMVIMEGNPHPGALKGRMSFQSFNPSIDKMNDEVGSINQMQTSPSGTYDQHGRNCDRVDRSGDSNVDANSENVSPLGLKRKQLESEAADTSPQKLLKSTGGDEGQSSSQNNRKGPHKPQKRDKLDWNVLRHPKATNRS